jgi:hypothetical protein
MQNRLRWHPHELEPQFEVPKEIATDTAGWTELAPAEQQRGA